MLSTAEKRRIAGRARTIHERIETPATGENGATVEDLDEIVETWRDNVAEGDPDDFRAWVDELGVTERQCRERLATHAWPDGAPLPDWVDRLDGLVAHVDGVDPSARIGARDPDTPFAEIITVFTEYARSEVDWSIAGHLLTDDAVDDLASILDQRLVRFVSRPLFVEFKTYLAQQDRELALADDPPIPDDRRRHYEAFVGLVLGDRLPELFLEYSFLARAVATIIDQWITVVEEFQRRLTADWEALEAAFGTRSGLGRLCDVRSDGDSHDAGRSTLGLQFTSGIGVAYKPRPVGVAVAFGDLLDWVAERDDGETLATPTVVDREEYGWMEWVDHRQCASTEEVERYYRRAGKLLCLLYVLRYTDGHAGNVIAAGESPAVVDLETLLSPGVERDGGDGIPDSEDSILRTGLLSQQSQYGTDGLPMGGLDANRVEWTGDEITAFERVNTDLMELTSESRPIEPDHNRPELDGEVVPPEDHSRALLDGFESTYRLLLDHREELLSASGPLAAFADREVRLVVAPTGEYDSLLTALESPSRLRTGIDFSLVATKMGARCSVDNDTPETPALYAAERRSLRRLEVPRFSLRADERQLRHAGAVVASFTGDAPVDAVRAEIDALSEAGLARQRDYLRLALGSYGDAGVPAGFTTATDDADGTDLDAAIRRFVRRQYDRLLDSADRTDDGTLTWHWARVGADAIEAHDIEDDLYGGRAGVALFGAAMARTFDDDRYRAFVDDVLAPLRDAPEERTGSLGLGGDGGVVYGLVTADRILDTDRYTGVALDRARTLTPSRLRDDTAAEVVAGCAGAIHGLLALFDRTGEDWLLERARVAGDHLLHRRTDTPHGPAWDGAVADRPVGGFAHGTAGIAYALGRLAAATGEDRYADAARAALPFEAALYDSDRRNWRDGRPAVDGCSTTWCYGRPGIGLARLGLADAVGGERVRADIDHALAGTDPAVVMDNDHVCCGNMGRVAWLDAAATYRNEPRYHERATELATACLRRARTNGRPLTRWPTERLVDPTFFTGEAGIGYVALGLLDADLPTVSLLE